ncbi:hypothetical protein TeGR_g10499 [Tetraparma gracilis]|jgi:hypothetical protein|uniref:Uncharacterized protein n=1 Tax=Tetraparma gracilis TaxID=2962635 RepID=A0ABQ6N3F7_9STRA|nr:hypothetical protein TeGR_g10499 [Tetraparma gracilis]
MDDISKPLSGAPGVVEMSRSLEPIKLRDARSYAQTLGPQQHSLTGGCYKLVVPKEARCCAGKCVGYARPTPCCGCTWTPAVTRCTPLDVFIPCCFCTGVPEHGRATMVDNKGNLMELIKVDGERDTLAWFSTSTLTSSDLGDTDVSCYCVK